MNQLTFVAISQRKKKVLKQYAAQSALVQYRVIKITRYPSTRRVIKLPVPARTRLFITRIYPLLSKSLLLYYWIVKITRYPSTRRVIVLPVPARTRHHTTRTRSLPDFLLPGTTLGKMLNFLAVLSMSRVGTDDPMTCRPKCTPTSLHSGTERLQPFHDSLSFRKMCLLA